MIWCKFPKVLGERRIVNLIVNLITSILKSFIESYSLSGRGNEARSKSLAVEDIEKKLDDIDKKEEEQSKRGKDPAADQDENKDKERGRRSKLEEEPLEGRGKKKVVEAEEDRVVVGRGKVKEEEDSDGSGKPASNRGGRKKGIKSINQGSKGVRQLPIKICTSPMNLHKFTPSVDYK